MRDLRPQPFDEKPIEVAPPSRDAMASLIEQHLLYGPLEERTYRSYAPSAPNDPDYVIEKINRTFGERADGSNKQARQERLEMWGKFEELLNHMKGADRPVVEAVHQFVKGHSEKAAREMGAEPKGLGLHLKEITAFSRAFYLDGARSRFPELMNDRHAQLLAEVAAPLHDSLKYLGKYKAQVMPDHEILTAELVRRTFEGKEAVLGGKLSTLTRDDCEFLAGVIGDHENIEKELGRSDRVHSADPVDRAKAAFFVADVLTGAIVPDGAGWRFDQGQLDTRFVDLYFRHVDPVKGKIFRPEWGLHMISDLTTTTGELSDKHCAAIAGAMPGESARCTLVRSAISALDRAIDADDARKASGPEAVLLQPEQRELVLEVRGKLSKITD